MRLSEMLDGRFNDEMYIIKINIFCIIFIVCVYFMVFK